MRLPITTDVAHLVGDLADEVQNRSLLLDKYLMHKFWSFDGKKTDDATRLNLLRLCDDGRNQLAREAAMLAYDAERARKKGDLKKAAEKNEAEMLTRRLSKVKGDDHEVLEIRAKHTRRFLRIFDIAYGDRALAMVAQLEGRLSINLAASLIQNTGICLDRLFGLPYIPGSAVKGVCRHAALEELKSLTGPERTKLFDLFYSIFGTSDNDFANGQLRPFKHLLSGRSENQKGAIAFLPAYPVNEARVVVDLSNVHYPDYYHSGQIEDLSKEHPRPNPFPAVEIGAQFAFCLVLNGINTDKLLLEQAKSWLEQALTVHGLGAKTSSGYGWFSLRPDVLQQLLDEERREAEVAAAKAEAEAKLKAKAEKEAIRRAVMPPDEQARERFSAMNQQDFATAVSGVATLDSASQKGLLLALLMHDRRDTWKTWKRSDKPANKARVEALLVAAKNLGIAMP